MSTGQRAWKYLTGFLGWFLITFLVVCLPQMLIAAGWPLTVVVLTSGAAVGGLYYEMQKWGCNKIQ